MGLEGRREATTLRPVLRQEKEVCILEAVHPAQLLHSSST
jgi:hypothetical protein